MNPRRVSIRRRFLRVGTALSLLLLAALAALWMVSRANGMLGLPGSLGAWVTHGEFCVFNQGRPNRGCVILYMMPQALPVPREKELDVGGIYFRLMFLDKGFWWTLMLPLGYPIGLSLALPALFLLDWDRRRAACEALPLPILRLRPARIPLALPRMRTSARCQSRLSTFRGGTCGVK